MSENYVWHCQLDDGIDLFWDQNLAPISNPYQPSDKENEKIEIHRGIMDSLKEVLGE